MLTLEALRWRSPTARSTRSSSRMTDMQGRLQGKRFHARFFLDEVVAHGTEACAYLLAVDTEMNTVDGYELASWETGYGDFMLVPDLATLRVIPWQPGTALVLADVAEAGLPARRPVRVSPRQVLRAQLGAGRGAAAGPRWPAPSSSSSSSRAATSRPGTPATGRSSPRTATTRTTPCSAPAGSSRCCGTSGTRWRARACTSSPRRASATSGSTRSRSATTTRSPPPTSTRSTRPAPRRSPPGTGTPSRSWPSRTSGRGTPATSTCRSATPRTARRSWRATGPYGLSPAGSSMLAGLLAGLRELTLLLAPTINSYKRFACGSFAPTTVAWGPDNRTCALRLVGHGPSLRVECRVPGGDVNPYLALAGPGRGGAVRGRASRGRCPPPVTGNAYTADGLPRVPATLDEALALWESSAAGGRRVRRGRGRATTRRWRGWSLRRTAGGDRLGAAPVLRANLSEIWRARGAGGRKA